MSQKSNKPSFNLNKKQGMMIAALITASIIAGTWILTSNTQEQSGGAGSPSAHAEAKEHGDTEHHGSKADSSHDHAKDHGDGEHHKEGTGKTGPHGGTVFGEQGISLEWLLAEEGGEPRFRAWLLKTGKPMPPAAVNVVATLVRPNGEVETINFKPEKDYLASIKPIEEPHVFNAKINLKVGDLSLQFADTREDGKVELTEEQIKAAAIDVRKSASARIITSMQLPGEIRFNEDRTAHVVPRLAGVVENVPANLGQQVKRGQVLATIASTALSEQRSEYLSTQKRLVLAKSTYEREKKLWEEKISAEQDYLQAQQAFKEAEIAAANSQQKLTALGASTAVTGSLNRYEIRAPFDGIVVEKHIALGEAVKEDTSIFTISDLSSVWAEIVVPAKELNVIRVGEKVIVNATAMDSKAEGRISYVGALIGQDTRTAKARVTLPNPQMAWRPGLFVNIDVVSGDTSVPVAVSVDAIQTVGDKTVVFTKIPDGFIAQPVTLGKTDGKLVEILSGIKAGTSYAGTGSFVLKSELGKGSAEHGH